MLSGGLLANASNSGTVKRSLLLPVVALLSVLASSSHAAAATPPPEPQLTNYAGVSIAPDGRYVADVESIVPADEDTEPIDRLVVRTIATGVARTIAVSCGSVPGCSVTVPSWSHDSKTIAYVVHAPKRARRDVMLADVTDTAIVPRRLVAFDGTFRDLSFSADDTKLAGLAVAGARKEVGATQAGAPIVGEIGSSPDEQRIAVFSLATGAMTYASPADLFVYEYDWFPDGNAFAGTAAPGDGDNNWWVAKLMRFDARTATASVVYAPASPRQQIASPRVSPSGKQIAFIGGIMSDFGSTGGDLFVLDVDAHGEGLAPVSDRSASVSSFRWACRGSGILAEQVRDANAQIVSLDFNVDRPSHVRYSAPESLAGDDRAQFASACVSPGDELALAAIRQTFERPPEIALSRGRFAADIAWTELTHANAAIPAETVAESIRWKSDDFAVQGWLLRPPHADGKTKRPLIVSVHGGPAAVVTPRFVGRGTTRDLLRRGYAVFYPNPRGSFGQGEAFAAANVRDFGYGDLRDILAGVDAVERADATIDDARLGITGGSYGGFMTMWAVTQTQRFKAAVAGAGIANWISYYGENGIDEWMIPFFGASAYDDPAIYRRSSPIDFITHVKTPTFAYVGERDVECPAPQSQEFWHAVVAQGVPTSLVIYAGEGHRIRAAKNTADVRKRTLAWFDRYLR
jgi:dipeptidyl aminopeptidase/acylaminoacyl peptidase